MPFVGELKHFFASSKHLGPFFKKRLFLNKHLSQLNTRAWQVFGIMWAMCIRKGGVRIRIFHARIPRMPSTNPDTMLGGQVTVSGLWAINGVLIKSWLDRVTCVVKCAQSVNKPPVSWEGVWLWGVEPCMGNWHASLTARTAGILRGSSQLTRYRLLR